jgi:serine/threonine protein kinase
VYLEHPNVKDIMFVKDKKDGELTKFGTDPQAENDDEKRKDWIQWLFSFRGQLQVISVPFVAGEHIPKTISDLQHITQELHTLHKKGIKHGDLRLWNMVFAKDGAKLLDFDFSGRNVYYPDGYATHLPDAGLRQPGTKHEEITEACDIKALLSVFDMFDVVVKDDDDDDDDDDTKLLAWWSRMKKKAYEKLLDDSSEVLSWMIEQFEPHSEVRIEIKNPDTRKELQMLAEMNRSKTRKTTELDTKSPEK